MVTFTKLRDGSWGLRGRDLVEGQTVTVTKRSGERQTATVGRVVWRGRDGTCLATKSGGSGRRVGNCRECGGPLVDASHHRAMGGLCGHCAFDEYDC